MENVLTLIAAPGGLVEDHVEAVRRACATGPGAWLGDRECWAAAVAAAPDAAVAAARAALGAAPVDVVALPAGRRRKKVLVADMDSTIIAEECLDVLAARAGVGERVADLTRRAMAGEIDFAAALAERVALLAGQPESLLEEVFETGITLRPGAATVTATMRAHGGVTGLVSGGFRFFTERVAAAAGFDDVNGNRLEIEDGRLTGRILGPIAGADEKRQRLAALAANHRVDLAETLAAGDGANDIAMLRAAGLGVAFHAKPAVRAAAAASLDHAGLVGLLYVQGYHRDEFVTVDG